MPTRETTIADAVRLFESAENPSGLSADHAWLGIYQTLLWHEPVDWLGFTYLPHIIDADKLRPRSPSQKRVWKSTSIWQKRAHAVDLYLAGKLNCSVESLPEKTDLLMKLPDYEWMQRQNSLGIAFVGLVKHVLSKFGSNQVSYETEVYALNVFPGITFPGRSSAPHIDLLVFSNGIPKAIISAKWSIRHDRLNDLTNECPIYKAAYERIYRGRRNRLLYYVVTNEYDPSRLSKILDDSCIDAVIHVHKAAVVDICGLDGRLDQLIDLADFVKLTQTW